jgi:hypothetical protein
MSLKYWVLIGSYLLIIPSIWYIKDRIDDVESLKQEIATDNMVMENQREVNADLQYYLKLTKGINETVTSERNAVAQSLGYANTIIQKQANKLEHCDHTKLKVHYVGKHE